jgi:Amt family ammonium transporter
MYRARYLTCRSPDFEKSQFLGTFGLWFGWYGFNPGSVLFISTDNQGNVAGLAAVNTTLGAAGGVLAGLITSTIIGARKTGLYEWDTTAAMNGGLTGLAAITAGCASVEPWAGFLIGIIAGWIYLSASKLILKLKIDDAVDAIPVHLFGGAWGVIACGFFSNPARMAASGVPTAHVGV